MALHDFFMPKTQDKVEVFRVRFDDSDDDEVGGIASSAINRSGAYLWLNNRPQGSFVLVFTGRGTSKRN
jgi:hypothetical protein